MFFNILALALPEVLDVRSPNVALRHPPELVSIPACADHLPKNSQKETIVVITDLPQVDIHPVVTGDEVAVVRLPILQLHQHGVVLRSTQQRERQHASICNIAVVLNQLNRMWSKNKIHGWRPGGVP